MPTAALAWALWVLCLRPETNTRLWSLGCTLPTGSSDLYSLSTLALNWAILRSPCAPSRFRLKEELQLRISCDTESCKQHVHEPVKPCLLSCDYQALHHCRHQSWPLLCACICSVICLNACVSSVMTDCVLDSAACLPSSNAAAGVCGSGGGSGRAARRCLRWFRRACSPGCCLIRIRSIG